MKIFIVGVNSFLGQSIAKHLSSRGHEITGTFRNNQINNNFKLIQFSLEDSPNSLNFIGIDTVLYCAHDFSFEEEASKKINIKGIKNLYNHAKEQGVEHHMYFSSYSAFKGSISIYGRIKYLLESYFLSNDETIIRPGLVLGHGGLCAKNIVTIRSLPIIPLPNSGKDPLPTISLNDFNLCLTTIIEKRLKGEFNLFYNEIKSSKDFVKQIRDLSKLKTRILGINTQKAIGILELLIKIGFKLESRLENLKGSATYNEYTYDSNLDELCSPTQNQKKALKSIIK
jgi:nucleoside-diphosphate-sugar epimerase